MSGLAKAGQKLKRLSSVKRFTRVRLPRGHLSGAFGLKPRRCGVEGNHVEDRSLAVERNEGRDRPSRARSALTAGASRTAADNGRAAGAVVGKPDPLSARGAFFRWRAHAGPIDENRSDRRAAP